jgi:D-xylose transport system ATP-binding protein
MAAANNTAPLVALKNIRKAFGGVVAVDDVSVNLHPAK